jgi:hypothetical protein
MPHIKIKPQFKIFLIFKLVFPLASGTCFLGPFNLVIDLLHEHFCWLYYLFSHSVVSL